MVTCAADERKKRGLGSCSAGARDEAVSHQVSSSRPLTRSLKGGYAS